MDKFSTYFAVGLFLLLGFVAVFYISVRLGNISFGAKAGYSVYAIFNNAAGLKKGASVEIAGVAVGKVGEIGLHQDGYRAKVELFIEYPALELEEDTKASIRTKGILGEEYVKLSPGASDNKVPVGGNLIETESAFDLVEVVGKFMGSTEKKP